MVYELVLYIQKADTKLIDVHGLSTNLGLFYAWRLGNCMFIITSFRYVLTNPLSIRNNVRFSSWVYQVWIQISSHTKAIEPSLPYYFTHSKRENHWIQTFQKGISAMWNANNVNQDWNSDDHVHFINSSLIFCVTFYFFSDA